MGRLYLSPRSPPSLSSSIADIPIQKSPSCFFYHCYHYNHHHHHHHHHNYNYNHNHPNHHYTMSSPAPQYVYIPNLVGRQMLRVPLEDVEVEDMVSYTPTSSQTTSTTSPSPPPFNRTVSRSPSISSVESTE